MLQYAHPLSVMEEIRSQGKFLTRNYVKEICQDFQSLTTPNQMMSYIYPIYSGADSDHTKHLVDPQLREGESCEWLAKLCKQIVAQGPTD